MDIIKTFVINNTNYDINIFYTNDVPLFRASEIGNVLGISQVGSSIRDFDETEKVVQPMHTPGGLQNVSMLTELGLYRLLMRSDKPIARPFQKWVCQILVSIRETGKYELQQQFKEQFEQKEVEIERAIYEKVNRDAERQKHLDILDVYDKKPLVYFARFGTGDRRIIKIGQTTDLKSRARIHKGKHDECILFKVFPVSEPQKFEHFLHLHPEIRKYKYNDPINDEVSNEAFLLDDEALQRALNIAVRNISRFKKTEASLKQLEGDVEQMKQMMMSIQGQLMSSSVFAPGHSDTDGDNVTGTAADGDHSSPESDADVESPKKRAKIKDAQIAENDDVMEEEPQYAEYDDESDEEQETETSKPKSRRGICTVNGDKIQRYSADGQELLETYSQMITMERDEDLLDLAMRSGSRLNRNTITNAAKKRYTYLGFRWAMMDRALPDNTVQSIGATTASPNVRNGPIVELNEDQSIIETVFANSEYVLVSINERLKPVGQSINSISRLCKAIKNGNAYKGRHYMAWSACSRDMQDAYIATGKDLPIPMPSAHCRPVEKIDPKTGRVIETYYSVAYVNKKCNVGKQTLQNAINGQYELNGYMWAYKK